MHAKFFVFKCRLNKLKPTLEAFINNLKHIYEVDKHVHLMEMTYEKFVKKWTPYNHLVTLDVFNDVCLYKCELDWLNLCSAWNCVCAYTHKCLSHVFQCYDDKIQLVTQHCLNKNMWKKNLLLFFLIERGKTYPFTTVHILFLCLAFLVLY